jgi:hypothetical protein
MAFDASNYIKSNDIFNSFAFAISDNTGEVNRERWYKNIRANRDNVKRCGWACDTFFEKGEGKASIILGASPALARQIDQLKELQHDSQFVLIGISSGIRYLVENGIRPPYVFISDCSDKMIAWFDGLDTTQGMTLIADLNANMEAVKVWEEKGGNVKYLATLTAEKDLDRKIAKWYRPVNGAGHFMSALSSQYNSAVSFAFQVLTCKVLIFVGNELSFPSNDALKDKYYVDRTDEKDLWDRRPVQDIYGKKIYTTFLFYQMKLVLEDYLGKISGAGWFFNATEAGIFGVTKGEPVPWIRQFTLRMAVKQARYILNYGRPMISDILARPTLLETAQYTGQRSIISGG